jgi:serine/threonine protein kinase
MATCLTSCTRTHKTSCCKLQCSKWIWGDSIGKGRNSSVCCVINPVTTSSVFKSGAQSELENEGQLLHELNHANIIQSYGIFHDNARPGVCYLALEQMKCSLGDIMMERR